MRVWLDDFDLWSTVLWRCQLRWLGLSQNSIELIEFFEKKVQKSSKMAVVWI